VDAPDRPSDAERTALEQLHAALVRLGTANDAQDHGAGDEARRLREEATAALRELLGRHAFLSALYPGLAGEVGTARLLAFGWSGYADDAERRLQHVPLERVPLERVAHFLGRATDLEDRIVELGKDGHAAALQRLRACLLREDEIAQATPLALRMILGALRFGLVKDASGVGALVDDIAAAARRQREAASRAGGRASRADGSPYREDRLWPPGEDGARDAARLASWRPNADERLAWALLVEQLLEEHRRFSTGSKE
jgi:hypothetical protein